MSVVPTYSVSTEPGTGRFLGMSQDFGGCWVPLSHIEAVCDETLAAERAACAELVRAAGCLCWAIRDWDDSTDLVIEGVFDNQGVEVGEEVTKHDRRCPVALAAAIEARK